MAWNTTNLRSTINGVAMTASEECKKAGLYSLAQLARISTVSERTLQNLHKNKHELFKIVLLGAVTSKVEQSK